MGGAGALPRLHRMLVQLTPRLRRIIPPLIAGHVLTLGVALIAVWSRGDLSWSGLDRMFRFWDAASYATIAEHGYPTPVSQDNVYLQAFLPGYPLLIRLLMVSGAGAVVAGLMVSLIAEAVALIYIDLLVIRERNDRDGLFAVWCVALAPTGAFLSLVFTESVFIAAAAASLYEVRRGNFLRASLAAGVAAATRITGLVLIPVLVVEWARVLVAGRRRPGRRQILVLAALSLPLAPFILYSLYLGVHSGDFSGFSTGQSSWSFAHHSVSPPWSGFLETWNTMTTADNANTRSIFAREVGAGLIGLVAVVIAWLVRGFPRSLALYCTLIWLISTSLSFWLSVPRYLLAMFPFVIVLADLTSRTRWVRPVVIAVSGGVMTWGAWTYASGAWLG